MNVNPIFTYALYFALFLVPIDSWAEYQTLGLAL